MSSATVTTDVALAGGPVLQRPSTYYAPINNTLLSANPTTIAIIGLVIVLFFGLSAYLGGAEQAQPPAYQESGGAQGIEIVLYGALLFLVAVNGLQYVYGVDIAAGVKNLFSPVPEVDIVLSAADAPLLQSESEGSDEGTSVPEITIADQVFHIPGNKYTYGDAKAVCQAYDARLATYDEIEDAYDAGGEWCSYGWSADQLALFPTQKSTYDSLQKIPGHENDCGRQGVNGGYIANRKVRFGVNCYGNKPVITPKEQKAMQNHSSYPLTHEEIVLDKKTSKYKAKLADIEVSPFNGTTWSRV